MCQVLILGVVDVVYHIATSVFACFLLILKYSSKLSIFSLYFNSYSPMLTLLKNVPYEMSDFWSHLHRGYNSNEIIHYMYFATPPALHVKSSSDFLSRSILLLRGWQNIYGDVFADDSLTKVICPRRRHCTVRHTDWVEPDASDIAVFYDHNLTSTPPHRIPGQLWVYHAGESQITLEVDHIENWDEYFNYTHDFREDATLKKFAKEFWKLDQPYRRNFTSEN